MISDKSREGWFGASDTAIIMSKWTSKTFAKWWLEKCGVCVPEKYTNTAMMAGTEYEHAIAEALEERIGKPLILDRQIIIEELRLRINLDGETDRTVCEIKTFKDDGKEWTPPKSYLQQVRVQMFGAEKKGMICAYPMTEENYKNFFLKIDKDKLLLFEVKPDMLFLNEYIKRLMYLCNCLERGAFPKEEDLR